MPVMLTCPLCDGETELRGTMDAWYITWCPACERLWRLELWNLVHETEADLKLPAITRGKVGPENKAPSIEDKTPWEAGKGPGA